MACSEITRSLTAALCFVFPTMDAGGQSPLEYVDSRQALGQSMSLSVDLGDLDGDGDLDAMFGNDGPNTVWMKD